MSNTFGFVSEDTFAAKMDEQNKLLAAIAANGGDSLRPQNWQGVQAIVRAGMANKVFSLGDQFVCKRGNDTLVWDVVGFDHDILVNSNLSHSMTLLMHDCYKKSAFDVREAFYATDGGMNIGKYMFLVGEHPYNESVVGNRYYFEITRAIPSGGQLLFAQTYDADLDGQSIETYASPSSTTPIETITLHNITSLPSGSTEPANLGTINGTIHQGFNAIGRALLGNSNWKESNVRQYLNSNAAAGSVFNAQNIFDRAKEFLLIEDGFMRGLDPEFLAAVAEVEKITEENTVFEGGTFYTTRDRFFLISREEAWAGREHAIDGRNGAYAYFKPPFSTLSNASTALDVNRIKYYNGAATYWWLRTPNTEVSSLPRYVQHNGSVSYSGASNPYGVVPACTIA